MGTYPRNVCNLSRDHLRNSIPYWMVRTAAYPLNFYWCVGFFAGFAIFIFSYLWLCSLNLPTSEQPLLNQTRDSSSRQPQGLLDFLPLPKMLIFTLFKVLDLSDCPSSYEQLPPTAGCLFREAAGIREELSTAFQVTSIPKYDQFHDNDNWYNDHSHPPLPYHHNHHEW